MFDLDTFLEDCRRAVSETEAPLAVKEVLERAVRTPDSIAEALPAQRAQLVPLLTSEELTVLHVVWAPGMRFRPHNHLMWAAIGLYGGREDNTFYRRQDDGIVTSGGRVLSTGDVALLGAETIHAVENPERVHTGAIHVYGGDITARPGRSEWDDETLAEVPYDFERTRRTFAAADVESAGSSSSPSSSS
jgi:predicted metal-dependent enzyme (double-stranded beta helix superfamily)